MWYGGNSGILEAVPLCHNANAQQSDTSWYASEKEDEQRGAEVKAEQEKDWGAEVTRVTRYVALDLMSEESCMERRDFSCVAMRLSTCQLCEGRNKKPQCQGSEVRGIGRKEWRTQTESGGSGVLQKIMSGDTPAYTHTSGSTHCVISAPKWLVNVQD